MHNFNLAFFLSITLPLKAGAACSLRQARPDPRQHEPVPGLRTLPFLRRGCRVHAPPRVSSPNRRATAANFQDSCAHSQDLCRLAPGHVGCATGSPGPNVVRGTGWLLPNLPAPRNNPPDYQGRDPIVTREIIISLNFILKLRTLSRRAVGEQRGSKVASCCSK